jgi:hypothetical protein
VVLRIADSRKKKGGGIDFAGPGYARWSPRKPKGHGPPCPHDTSLSLKIAREANIEVGIFSMPRSSGRPPSTLKVVIQGKHGGYFGTTESWAAAKNYLYKILFIIY